ncbi:MAG: hypothetical protein PUA93_05100 [Eubacteriales bacterium]|nr:hypothetical protein [Eubacteriales bacterium]
MLSSFVTRIGKKSFDFFFRETEILSETSIGKERLFPDTGNTG